MNKNYVSVSYSERRNEVYVYDIRGKQLFSIQEERLSNIPTEILEDDELLRDYVIENFESELNELLDIVEYYNKIINPQDNNTYSTLYKVSLYNYDNHFYYVFANYEHQALEILAGYLTDKGETGYIFTATEVKKDYSGEEIENSFIYVDCSEYCLNNQNNWIFYLSVEHTSIQKVD